MHRASAVATGRGRHRAATLEPFFLNPGVSDARRARALREMLEGVLADATWARQCAEPLSRLLGLPVGDELASNRRSDPQLAADRMRVSLADLISEMARRPLAIVLDDAQWADPPSLALLDDLLGRLSTRPLLVFIASRSELGERDGDLFAGREMRRVDEDARRVTDRVLPLSRAWSRISWGWAARRSPGVRPAA